MKASGTLPARDAERNLALVTLAQRLLVAIGVLTVATTLALAFGVREAWRRAEEEQFQLQFESTVDRLGAELGDEVRDLPALLGPLCDHDPVLDAALVDLRADQLDAGQRLALSLRVVELMKAMRLDELVLLTGHGEILGAGHASGLVGSHDPKLAARAPTWTRDKPTSERVARRLRSSPIALVRMAKRRSGSMARDASNRSSRASARVRARPRTHRAARP